MGNRVFTDPRPQQFKKDGVTINSNGKLYFYEPGATSTTLKTVYSDAALSVPLANPVILDDQGRFPTIYMQESDYAVKLTDSSDVQIWRVDSYNPPTLESQFNDWDASITYAVNDYVRYTDGKYYVSLVSPNKGRIPSSSPAYWSELFFLSVYNSSESYSSGDIVYYNGALWEARVSSTGTTPGTDETKWVLSGTPAAKANYVSTSFDYYVSKSSSAPSVFDVAANVTKSASVYETIGPTLSGADHIWADYTPSQVDNAKAVILSISMSNSKSTGSDSSFRTFVDFKEVGATNFISGSVCGGYGGTTHGPDDGYSEGTVVVPIDSNGVFEVKWNDIGSPDSEAITIRFEGLKA